MAKNPLIQHFNHIPDQCSITRAAKAFDLDIEDILNWAEKQAIKLYVDLKEPLPIIGDGTEIDDYLRAFKIIENQNKLGSTELKLQEQAVEDSLSSIDIGHTSGNYYAHYQIEGRWAIPPFYISNYRKTDEIEVEELYADFSLLCGVELTHPFTINIHALNICQVDLIRIAQAIKEQVPLPCIYDPGAILLPKKSRKPRTDICTVTFISQLLHLISDLDGITSRPRQFAILQSLMAERGLDIAVEESTFKGWFTRLNQLSEGAKVD